jgi:TonB family protein
MASFLQSARCYFHRGTLLLCLLGLAARGAQGKGAREFQELSAKEASRLLLSQTPPEYPVLAKVNYIQGRVRVQIQVAPDGTVAQSHVLSGNPLLAAAVLNSVGSWRYRPYVSKDGPSSFATKVEVNFSLRTSRMDLVPTQAESDFRRQVKPPEVLTKPRENSVADVSVRLRVLVSAEGKVIDSEILKGIPSLFEGARKIVKRWSFQPARWGTLTVPWYLDVDVPLDNAPAEAGVRSLHDTRPGRTE